VTDGPRSYKAAMKRLGNAERQALGRWLSNRAENSNLPPQRRERTRLKFRQMKTLQKFSSVNAASQNPFNQDRPLISRAAFEALRSAAFAEWKTLAG
jgi:putative transposase